MDSNWRAVDNQVCDARNKIKTSIYSRNVYYEFNLWKNISGLALEVTE
jgi:hypothetical protein